MTSFINKLFQFTASLAQVANQLDWITPNKYKPFIAIALGISQAVVGVLAHYFNPDGTPAEGVWNK